MTAAAQQAKVKGMAADSFRPGRTGLRRMLVCGILAAACDHLTAPTAPFGQGVSLYPDSLYRGKGITIDGDVSNLFDLRGPCGDPDNSLHYEDCISSLRVPAGWSATVYRDRKFRGASATYTEDVPDLDLVPGPCHPGFNDCISSIRVRRIQ
jgi:hypothetical protein